MKKRKLFEPRYFALIIGLLISTILVTAGNNISLTSGLELCFYDTYINSNKTLSPERLKLKISSGIQIIGIDEKALSHWWRWPFPRSIWADLINTFTFIKNQNERERTVFLDLGIIEPGPAENDFLLVKAIKENERVFLDIFYCPCQMSGELQTKFAARQEILYEKFGVITNIKGNWKKLCTNFGVEAPIKPVARSVRGYGNASYIPDVDDVFRRQALIVKTASLLEEIPLDELCPESLTEE